MASHPPVDPRAPDSKLYPQIWQAQTMHEFISAYVAHRTRILRQTDPNATYALYKMGKAQGISALSSHNYNPQSMVYVYPDQETLVKFYEFFLRTDGKELGQALYKKFENIVISERLQQAHTDIVRKDYWSLGKMLSHMPVSYWYAVARHANGLDPWAGNPPPEWASRMLIVRTRGEYLDSLIRLAERSGTSFSKEEMEDYRYLARGALVIGGGGKSAEYFASLETKLMANPLTSPLYQPKRMLAFPDSRSIPFSEDLSLTKRNPKPFPEGFSMRWTSPDFLEDLRNGSGLPPPPLEGPYWAPSPDLPSPQTPATPIGQGIKPASPETLPPGAQQPKIGVRR